MTVYIIENDKIKYCRSESFNYNFSKITGVMARWGKNESDDPVVSPSAEILDIELSSICNSKSCSKFCYKGNSNKFDGQNMSLNTFKKIMNTFPKTQTGALFLQQLAAGIGSVSGNPELFDILNYARHTLGVIPNITVNGFEISDDEITKLANICGAVAVSFYNKKDCFDTIYRLTEAMKEDSATLKQVNIHKTVSVEEYNRCINLLNMINDDSNMKSRINAVVFLALKPKGFAEFGQKSISDMDKLYKLYDLSRKYNIIFGCDSCSAPSVLQWLNKNKEYQAFQSIDPCEACCSSSYISVTGEFYPCSFAEKTTKWESGIDMLKIKHFNTDVWMSDRVKEWRNNLLQSSQVCTSCNLRAQCRSCPLYDITICRETNNSTN